MTGVHVKTVLNNAISEWIEQFIFDRKIRGLKDSTIIYYKKSLRRFLAYCEHSGIDDVSQITAKALREFIASMSRYADNTKRNTFKAARAFLCWFEAEEIIDGWRSPCTKVSTPKADEQPIAPIEMKDVIKVIRKCGPDNLGLRDKAILMVLVDTGIRASELVALDIDDLNEKIGQIVIKHGKGGKVRVVFVGRDTRKAIRRYLSTRTDDLSALFISHWDKTRLTTHGLRWLVIRRFKAAKVKPKGIHTFRRLFALTMLRNGTDIVTLSRLMGHSTTDVLRRYLAQTDDDLREAHAKASPVDNWL